MGEAFENADAVLGEGVFAIFGEPDFCFGLAQAFGVVRARNGRFRTFGLCRHLFLRHIVLIWEFALSTQVNQNSPARNCITLRHYSTTRK